MRKNYSLLLFFSLFISAFALASSSTTNFSEQNLKSPAPTAPVKKDKPRNKMWYFSWGYNKDYWSNSDIHVVQNSLDNNFTVHNVAASDCPGWNDGLFNSDLMTPQYNIRIGHFMNADHTWAIELNFDHTKYNINPYQVARVSGTINGQPVNQNTVLTPQYFNYELHNGANSLMLNFVRRKEMYDFPRAMLDIAAVSKIGAGVMLPHPENTIMGNTVDVGPKASGNYFGWNHGWWQMGGWTTGIEAGFQLTFHKTVYLELTDKEAYASLSNIQVYEGQASQTVWLNEVICSLGAVI